MTLSLSGAQHQELARHLFPGDGKEAAAILVCGDAGLTRARLLAREVLLVPHRDCDRSTNRLTWPGEWIEYALDKAEASAKSIILVHSHPGGFADFSLTDDQSDRAVIPHIFGGWSGAPPRHGHGSAIMLPSGRIFGRLYTARHELTAIDQVTVAGDDINYWFADEPGAHLGRMPFAGDQTRLLARLHACIIGVSGTGSIITEQAARLGFGALTLIDFDVVEAKNLNRILNSATRDAERSALKVEVTANALRTYRPDLAITQIATTIAERQAVLAAAACDVIFSCVDSAEGRQIADLVAQSFMLPLFDMGVSIPTRRDRQHRPVVADVLGRVDYVQPGGSTLFDRGVFSAASLRAEYLAKVAPDDFARERDAGYIRGAPDEAPSVISLNMRTASAAMLEFLARVLPFRHVPNRKFARTTFSLAEPEEEYFPEDAFAATPTVLGRGAAEPLLGIPSLGETTS
ncbi:MAG: ThiF family adenylyltransferase [Hyphomonadaceae bacterium]